MKVDITYWKSFTQSWFRAVILAASKGDLDKVKALTDGGRRVIDLLIEPFQDFPESRRLGLSTALDFYAWAKVNKDPFKPARVMVEKLKQDHLK